MNQPAYIFLSVLLVIGLLSGCKEHTCECISYNSNIPNKTLGHANHEIKGTKSKAKQKCSDASEPKDNLGNYTSCKIK